MLSFVLPSSALLRVGLLECRVAGASDRSLYQWSPVPQGKAEAARYVDTALAWRDAG